MTAKIKTQPKSHLSRYRHKPRNVSKSAFDKAHWPYLPLLVVLLVLLVPSLTSGVLSSSLRSPGRVKVLDYATSMSINGLLGSTNASRAANGVSSLNLNSSLIAAAQAKANDMASRNYWSHNTPEGSPPWIFVTAQGYSYQKMGENLATGFADEQSTIDGWMASPPHKENLLNADYTEVGFGFANNANYTSAGGGPMTIIVAFYGLPLAAAAPAAPTSAPPKAMPPPASAQTSGTPPASDSTPVAETPVSQPAAKTPAKQPVSTDTDSKNQVSRPSRSTRATLAFAGAPVASYATSLTTFLVVAAAVLLDQ